MYRPWESHVPPLFLHQFWFNWHETGTVWKFRNRASWAKKQRVNRCSSRRVTKWTRMYHPKNCMYHCIFSFSFDSINMKQVSYERYLQGLLGSKRMRRIDGVVGELLRKQGCTTLFSGWNLVVNDMKAEPWLRKKVRGWKKKRRWIGDVGLSDVDVHSWRLDYMWWEVTGHSHSLPQTNPSSGCYVTVTVTWHIQKMKLVARLKLYRVTLNRDKII